MTVEIRAMVPADRARIIELLAVQLAEHGVDLAGEALGRAVDGVLEDPRRGAFLVAALPDGGPIVGLAYLGFTWTLEHGGLVSWLEELYVVPELRGRGVGASLLEGAMAQARARGALAMDLEVDQGHARAANLYRRAGFSALPRARWQRRL
jgi:GNAT superfamily N-acetyltransferase